MAPPANIRFIKGRQWAQARWFVKVESVQKGGHENLGGVNAGVTKDITPSKDCRS